MGGTGTSTALRAVIDAAVQQGLPRAPLEEALGIDPGRHPLDEHVPAAAVQRFWAVLEELSGDELIGIHLAQHIRPGPFFYLLVSSPDLETGWAAIAADLRLLFDAETEPVTLKLTERRAFGYRRHPLGDPLIPQSEAAVVGTVAALCRRLLGGVFGPSAYCFQHPAPPWAGAMRRWAGCPVRYDEEFNGLEVPEAAWRTPFSTHDPALLDLVRYATGHVTVQGAGARSLGERLEAWLGDRLDRERSVAEEEAARALGLSARSLQRKLAEEGRSFRACLDSVRRRLAVQLLGRPELSVGEVAGRLGYSQPSQFTRAFRRWHGVSPAAWCDQRRGAGR